MTVKLLCEPNAQMKDIVYKDRLSIAWVMLHCFCCCRQRLPENSCSLRKFLRACSYLEMFGIERFFEEETKMP